MKNPIKGGIGDDKKTEDFDPKQVVMGVQVEKEHTPDPAVALDITKDHLAEHKKYYTGLKQMEEKLAKTSKKSPKFERCVLAVKEKNPDYETKGPNPWAVCHASLKKCIIQKSMKNLKKLHGWSEDDLLDTVKEAKREEVLEKGMKSVVASVVAGAAALGATAAHGEDLHSKLNSLNVVGEYSTPQYPKGSITKELHEFHPDASHPTTNFTKEGLQGHYTAKFFGPDAHKAMQIFQAHIQSPAPLQKAEMPNNVTDIKTKLKVKAKRSTDVVMTNRHNEPVTVSFTFRPSKNIQEEDPSSLHHILPSDDHASAMLGHPGLLKAYIAENQLLDEAKSRGFSHITLHIPGSNQ